MRDQLEQCLEQLVKLRRRTERVSSRMTAGELDDVLEALDTAEEYLTFIVTGLEEDEEDE